MAPKREKGQTFSLAELAKTIQNEAPAVGMTSSSWADEEIELPSAPMGQTRYDSRPGRILSSSGGGRFGRDEAPAPVHIDQRSLPRSPPFMAFVGGLGRQPTEEELKSFFGPATIKSIRFPRPDERGFRGFCYVEFYSVDTLTDALMKSGQSLNGRPCRIDIGTSKGEPEQENRNWREGKVVDRAEFGGFESRDKKDLRGPRADSFASAATTQSDWRSTAKPVEVAPKELFAAPFRRDSARPPVKEDVTCIHSKPKANPFGAARPREEVLAAKAGEQQE